MRALNNQFRPNKCVVATGMIRIEMGANQEMNVARSQAKGGQLVDNRRYLQVLSSHRDKGAIGRNTAIDQDIFPIVGLNEITGYRNQSYLLGKISWSIAVFLPMAPLS